MSDRSPRKPRAIYLKHGIAYHPSRGPVRLAKRTRKEQSQGPSLRSILRKLRLSMPPGKQG